VIAAVSAWQGTPARWSQGIYAPSQIWKTRLGHLGAGKGEEATASAGAISAKGRRSFGVGTREEDLERWRDVRDLEQSKDPDVARRANQEKHILSRQLRERHGIVDPDMLAPPSRVWPRPEDRD
jgi:hypothetical protein